VWFNALKRDSHNERAGLDRYEYILPNQVLFWILLHMDSSQWENWNCLSCCIVSFITSPRCQFRGVGQGNPLFQAQWNRCDQQNHVENTWMTILINKEGRFWTHKTSSTSSGKWAVMYVCLQFYFCLCFSDFSYWFWNSWCGIFYFLFLCFP
jgi:hypothetical protein